MKRLLEGRALTDRKWSCVTVLVKHVCWKRQPAGWLWQGARGSGTSSQHSSAPSWTTGPHLTSPGLSGPLQLSFGGGFPATDWALSGHILQAPSPSRATSCRKPPAEGHRPLRGDLCPSPRAAPSASCTRAWTPDSREKRVSPVPFRVRIYLLSPVMTLWSLLYSWSLGHTLLTNVVWLLATEKKDKKSF